MARPNKYRELIGSLIEEAATGGISGEFSADELCERFEVSRQTMLLALRPLQKCGLIRMIPGQKIRLLQSGGLPPIKVEESFSAPEKLAARIEERIAEGEYPVDHALPKAGFFCREMRSSTHTCAKAMQILLKRGKVRKEGKKWVVGPMHSRSPNALSFPYVVGIFQSNPDDFSNLCTNAIWSQFTEGFLDEIVKYGVSLRTVRLDTTVSIGDEIAGKSAFGKMIKSLGNRYLGSLLIPPIHNGSSETVEWLEFLSAYKFPSIWLCLPHDWARIENEVHKIGNASLALYGEWRDSITVPGMAGLAIDTLFSLGHRNILFIDSVAKKDDDWFKKRLHNLRVRVKHYAPDLVFNAIDVSRGLVFPQDQKILKETAKVLAGRGYSFKKQPDGDFETQYLQTAAVLLTALQDYRPTAIIAPNDDRAAKYRLLLEIFGLRIPGDISILSFDNSLRARTPPLSSIDFGLRSLGYKIFHAIYGDLQPSRKANRIWAEPKMNSYSTCGSVANSKSREQVLDSLFNSLSIQWSEFKTLIHPV